MLGNILARSKINFCLKQWNNHCVWIVASLFLIFFVTIDKVILQK